MLNSSVCYETKWEVSSKSKHEFLTKVNWLSVSHHTIRALTADYLLGIHRLQNFVGDIKNLNICLLVTNSVTIYNICIGYNSY